VTVSRQRSEYVKRFIDSDTESIEEFVQSTQSTCPFCPQAIEKNAPKFPPEINLEGRIQVGEAICFPSLFAHEDFNGIVVPTKQHKLQLNQFSTKMLTDAFAACLQYFDSIYAAFPTVRHSAIAMNFLPPAGSTIAHPHIQALASDIPLDGVSNLIAASKKYADETGSNYWHDLIETERKLGTRYLANLNGVDWLTPYAPLGLNEADAVISNKPNFESLAETELNGLAEGFVRILRYYHDLGIMSFNAAIYSGAREGPGPLSVTARVVSRYGYKSKFVSDVWAMQYLLGGQEIFESPEETRNKLSTYFK
jgi:galactose-1-phosphate uridylyltransferase